VLFLTLLPQLSTDSSGGDGGGGNNGGRRTNSTWVLRSTHSTGTAGSSGTGNSIHMGNIHNSREIRPLFRPRRQRQNAARERKPVPLPPIRLREVSSSSLFFLPLIKQEIEGKVFHFIQMDQPWDTP